MSRRRESRLNGATAARDLKPVVDVLTDLVDTYDDRDELVGTGRRTVTVAALIPKGARIVVRDGRAYPAEEAQP